jgi:hypothetical protein
MPERLCYGVSIGIEDYDILNAYVSCITSRYLEKSAFVRASFELLSPTSATAAEPGYSFRPSKSNIESEADIQIREGPPWGSKPAYTL